MNAEELKALQTLIKERYKKDPAAALISCAPKVASAMARLSCRAGKRWSKPS